MLGEVFAWLLLVLLHPLGCGVLESRSPLDQPSLQTRMKALQLRGLCGRTARRQLRYRCSLAKSMVLMVVTV